MAESWYKIGGRVLSFNSRPISFIVETIDGSDFTLTLENGESGTYSSGGTSTILYSGTNSHPNFSFSNPLNIKRFETSDAIYVDNSQMGWLNIESLVCTGNSRGDFTDIGLLTSLTTLHLIGNSFTGDMSDVSDLTSLTTLRLNSNSFTGDMSGVSDLTSLIYLLQLQGHLFTGDMSGVSDLTSLTTLRLIGNSFTGDMSDVKLLTSLTTLHLIGNYFTGDMSDVKLLTSLTSLQLTSNLFTGDMSDVTLLTSLTSLQLNCNLFTGDMSDVKLLTSLNTLQLLGSSFTGDMSDVKLLTSLTTLQLDGNLFAGDMSDIKLLTSLTFLYLRGDFTIDYTSTTFAPNYQRWYFRPTTATNPMSSAEIDQLLIDASQTTWVGNKDIYVDGNNGVRTSASDAAVTTLQAMGVTLYLNV